MRGNEKSLSSEYDNERKYKGMRVEKKKGQKEKDGESFGSGKI